MKLTLKHRAIININGVDVELHAGTNVELDCDMPEHASELIALTKLPIEQGHEENGKWVTYVRGKRVETDLSVDTYETGEPQFPETDEDAYSLPVLKKTKAKK